MFVKDFLKIWTYKHLYMLQHGYTLKTLSQAKDDRQKTTYYNHSIYLKYPEYTNPEKHKVD